MAFTHTVSELKTVNGQIIGQEVGRFYVNVPFGENAMREFRRIARRNAAGRKIKRVSDSTLARFHYAIADGTVVWEVR